MEKDTSKAPLVPFTVKKEVPDFVKIWCQFSSNLANGKRKGMYFHQNFKLLSHVADLTLNSFVNNAPAYRRQPCGINIFCSWKEVIHSHVDKQCLGSTLSYCISLQMDPTYGRSGCLQTFSIPLTTCQ